MLGYMRHEGFIPWDDDVDVAMLRADYDRFMKEAGPLLPDRFFLQTRETDPNTPYLFSKIRLDDTEYITKYNDKRKFHKGICLDIFPFDYLPEDKDERERFVKEVKDLAKAHHLIARRQFPIPEEECTPRNEQESRYIEEQKELLKSYWEKDLTVSQQAYLDAATRYNGRAEELKLRTVASFVPSYTFIDLNDLLPYQRGQFEDIEVSVPKRPDIFLSMQYGDFMKLPPKHMQVAHRLLRWSTWEASGEATTDDM
jgi:lipopolysaccharide cholinephosphotransferase